MFIPYYRFRRRRLTVVLPILFYLLLNYLFVSNLKSEPSQFIPPETSIHFIDILRRFNLEKEEDQQSLLFALQPYLIAAPIESVNLFCRPPAFSSLPESCTKLESSRKIAYLIQFDFQVDALEILLQEVNDVVEKIFILEHTFATNKLRKPQVYEYIQATPRFQPFLDKIVRFVGDDPNKPVSRGLLIERFFEWNQMETTFTGSDLIVLGRADQIPDRNSLDYLKHCEAPTSLSIGLWAPAGDDMHVGFTDNPVGGGIVPGLLYSSEGPHVITYDKLVSTPHCEFESEFTILGGMQMVEYRYLPLVFSKLLAESHATNDWQINKIIEILNGSEDNEVILGHLVKELTYRPEGRIALADFKDMYPAEYKSLVYKPWFYSCNRDRFPALNSVGDLRYRMS